MQPQFAVQTCEVLLADWQVNTGGQLLSAEERSRAQAIVSPTRRKQFLAGRWLAKQLLCDAWGGTRADWCISADPQTKPRVLGCAAQISISHSGEYVACALANDAVGIDVERVGLRRSVADMAQWVCHADEQRTLGALAGDPAQWMFHQLWTRKEARLKQSGQPFDMAVLRGIQTAPCPTVLSATGGTWIFNQQGLVLSLAVEQGLADLQAHWPTHWLAEPVQWHHYV